jgi:DnaA family protein
MAKSLLGIYVSPDNYRQYDQLTLAQSQSLLIVDDYDRFADESWLFHLYNLIKEHHGQAVYFGEKTPSAYHFNLPDLASRLRSLPCLTIQEPDDDLFRQLLKKELYNKGIVCGDEIMEYIYRRFDRSYETIHNLVQLIDENTLQHQRSLSLPFLKEISGEN